MFIPTTPEEVREKNWDTLDVILVTGDTYIDSPSTGAAVIGQLLMNRGYRVGIIAQPDVTGSSDITRLGEPRLFWGITSGSVDSMVSNYTSTGKRRKHDDFTPGGENTMRPDRALIAYSNLIRRYFKNTAPLVLGGIEASLRRISHYDDRSGSIRRSILFDAKADILVYGMGEPQVLELAETLKEQGREYHTHLENTRGICYISKIERENYISLPSFEETASDKKRFTDMFTILSRNSDPFSASGLTQKHGERFLVQTPPASPLTQDELDAVYALPYERRVHPFYLRLGKVRAMDTIRFSITTHRGCLGECAFCGIALHQGRRIVSRSEASILSEAEGLVTHPDFKGIISDVGGPTANMYGVKCAIHKESGYCPSKNCAFPDVCENLQLNHRGQLQLLRKLRKIPGIRKVFVSSGIRHDLVLADGEEGKRYLEELMEHHISGQMKIAPEHTEEALLSLMKKPGREVLDEFIDLFNSIKKRTGKNIFLTYYFIAAHPGSGDEEMKRLKKYAEKKLKMVPRQVQVFTPTPSTLSTLLYYTGSDPSNGKKVYVEKDTKRKVRQKEIITGRKK
jgi:uncharacterized radical SAM protein YgiQ